MDKQGEGKVRMLAGTVASELGFDLVDVSLSGSARRVLLRITIDAPGGVTLDDCETFSRRIESLLDVEDVIDRSYTLEVSSPGLDRPLKTPNDFRKAIGKPLRITTNQKIQGQTFFVGRLTDMDETTITISLARKEGTRDMVIPFEQIAKAQVEIEMRP